MAKQTESECEGKRREAEERGLRWIETLAQVDEDIRRIVTYLDYHRKRSERREYIETLRRRLVCLLKRMK